MSWAKRKYSQMAGSRSSEPRPPMDSVLTVQLAEKRIARVHSYMGIPLVDIREIYLDKSKQPQPGRMGISLTLDQFRALSSSSARIIEAMEAALKRLEGSGVSAGAGASASAGAGGASSSGGAGMAATDGTVDTNPKAGDSGDPEDNEGGGSANAELTISLSEKRVARVNTFKGYVLVDIREMWTDATGAMKPSKKGISLRLEQFRALAAGSESIVTALEGLSSGSGGGSAASSSSSVSAGAASSSAGAAKSGAGTAGSARASPGAQSSKGGAKARRTSKYEYMSAMDRHNSQLMDYMFGPEGSEERAAIEEAAEAFGIGW